jgi:hypothetical protein
MTELTRTSLAITDIKAGWLIFHDDIHNTVRVSYPSNGDTVNGVALKDCKSGEQCQWGLVADLSGHGEIENTELWAKISEIFESQLPHADRWSDYLYEKHMAFTAMLDLNKRLLAMEQRLNENVREGE